MTELLLKKFVKNYENTIDPAVRADYGRLGGMVGIVCNIILTVAKYIIGSISGSAAIISDAVNNLSDSVNSIATMAGMSAAAKPADREHPYGHGRTEYLTALCIGTAIVYVGLSLFSSSVKKIIEPKPITPSAAVIVVLVLSILLKVWLTVFNKRLGERAHSTVLLANSQDARNDIFATSAALVGTVCAYFSDLPADAAMGAVVSLYITVSGVNILKETIGDILGRAGDEDTVAEIKGIIDRTERIWGVHDIMVHDYGPGRAFASCHVEADSRETLMDIHDIVDDVEREIKDKLGMVMTVHVDPVDMQDEELVRCRALCEGHAQELCGKAFIHDLRIVHKDTEPLLEFDMIFPYGSESMGEERKKSMEAFLEKEFPDYRHRFNIEYE